MGSYTDITIVLDRSGSMEEIREFTIKGFNTFVKQQKKTEGKAALTLVQFSNKFETLYEARDIKKVKDISYQTYVPHGTTALLDTIGHSILAADSRIAEFKPDHIIFVIITDGYENASYKYNLSAINELIDERKEWEFVFLGANQDAIKEAGSMGISPDRSLTFLADSEGVTDLFYDVSNNIKNVREGKSDFFFSQEQRKKQNRRKY
ncbi:MAG: VWA domain-containing protein [Calditrichae bacterium]|nr:VWA domain-containing protein [Calditrichia bacterium]